VRAQQADPESILSLYRQLLSLRRQTPALNIGRYVGLPAKNDVVAFVREYEGARYVIALNLGSVAESFDTGALGPGCIVVSTRPDRIAGPLHSLTLAPNEGVIVQLT
jgi:glycosidase